MKKLLSIGLSGSRVLNVQEMKSICGGYDDYDDGSGTIDGDGICAWSSSSTGATVDGCTNSAAYAESKAGEQGWWCCNCSDAKFYCK